MARVRDRRQANWFWMNKNILDDYGPKIGANGIAVYAFLARCANEQGHAFPSIRYIAKHVALSTNTVMKYLEILADVGLIECKTRRDEAGDMTSTEYVLLTPLLGEPEECVSTSETGVSTSETHHQEVSQPVRQVSQQLRNGVSTSETFQEVIEQERKPPVSTDVETSPTQTEKVTGLWIVETYNRETPPDHTKHTIPLSPARHQRANDYAKRFPDPAFWHAVFAEVWESPWMRGQRASNGHRAVKRDLFWMLQCEQGGAQENCLKVFEGKYRDSPDDVLHERLSIPEYRSAMAGQRFVERGNAHNRADTVSRRDDAVISDVQYRID